MIEVRMKYMGRGIPLPFDVELSISAKETADEKRRKGTCPRTSLVDGAGARSTTRECLSEMLTPAPGSGGAGLVSVLAELQVGLADIGTRLDGFGSRLDKIEGGSSQLPKGKCWICQSDGHLAATCGTAKGKELREKKLASAAKPAAEAK